MSTGYNETQLDALRELANIASGTAATSLSQMLAREVDLSVPMTTVASLADAVEQVGEAGEMVTGVVLQVNEGLGGIIVLLLKPPSVEVLCRILGVESDSEFGASAIGEIGNIVGAAYLTALGSMTSLELIPSAPAVLNDLLGAIIASTIAATVATQDEVILVDSRLTLTGEVCEIKFMLLPTQGEISGLLAPFGLAEAAG